MKSKKTVVSFSVDEELLKKIDEAAAANYCNRSAFIIKVIFEYLKNNK